MNRENGLDPGFGVRIDEASNGVLRVEVSGEIDLSNADRMAAALSEAAAADGSGVVADLTLCSFIDSSGVRALLLGLEAASASRNGGGGGRAGPRFAIAASARQVRYVLELTGLDRAVPVHASFESASRALDPRG